jgi:hypothetical protein
MSTTCPRSATILALVAFSSTSRAAPPIPTVIKAEPAPEWNAKFAGNEGWIGGDGVYSTLLSPKRVLWLFGDTLLGSVKDGKRAGATMVNNTVGILDLKTKDAAVRFTPQREKDRKPSALFVPADGKGWFWAQAAARVGARLFVFLPQIQSTKEPRAFGFKHIGQWLAVVENPDDEPEQWRMKQHKLPFAEFGPDRERSWGAAVLADVEFLYVYGYDDVKKQGFGKRRLTLARVPIEKVDDFAAWCFRTKDGWSERAEDTAPLADGLATELSVSRVDKGYVAVYTQDGIGDRIVGRFADAPEGPWSAPLLLYKCPEMAGDMGLFCYAAKAHPWAARGNELLVSYCVNSFDFARLFREAEVYRPKFVRVVLGPAK